MLVIHKDSVTNECIVLVDFNAQVKVCSLIVTVFQPSHTCWLLIEVIDHWSVQEKASQTPTSFHALPPLKLTLAESLYFAVGSTGRLNQKQCRGISSRSAAIQVKIEVWVLMSRGRSVALDVGVNVAVGVEVKVAVA